MMPLLAARPCQYYLDLQWRSSDFSTDVNIMVHNFREGHMTLLLTHALHRAPSVSLETWSGEERSELQ